MQQPLKAFVLDNFFDFLQGAEVRAGVIGKPNHLPATGEHVMVFKHSIAAETEVPVPKSEQSHYIGIEGMVTAVETSKSNDRHPVFKVKKI